MKPSPLQLKWVTYPSAQYEIVEDFQGPSAVPTAAKVVAEVTYSLTGEHLAYIEIESDNEAVGVPYRFAVTAVAGFSFDLDIARKEYKPQVIQALPPVLAVNLARILYAGAREHIAMMTARGTFGAAVLDSIMLEPHDVQIKSDAPVEAILKEIFGATVDELRPSVAIDAESTPKPKPKPKPKPTPNIKASEKGAQVARKPTRTV